MQNNIKETEGIDLRLPFDALWLRAAVLFIILLVTVPLMIVGSAGVIVVQAALFALNVPWMLCKSLVISVAQACVNTAWFVNKLVTENL